jgi:hypothetical protein
MRASSVGLAILGKLCCPNEQNTKIENFIIALKIIIIFSNVQKNVDRVLGH